MITLLESGWIPKVGTDFWYIYYGVQLWSHFYQNIEVKSKWLEKLDDVSYSKFATYWNDSLRIAITYNKGDGENYYDDSRADLSVRILNSYLTQDGSQKSFFYVEPELDAMKWTKLSHTLEAIAAHYQKWKGLHNPPNIILIGDEIIKSDNPSKVLSSMCGLMEEKPFNWNNLHVISTTLTDTMLIDAMTKSNRKIDFIPMPVLSSIQELFPPEKNLNATLIATTFGGVSFNFTVNFN